MSREQFLTCDGPDCGGAASEDRAEGWFTLCAGPFGGDDDDDTQIEMDLCPECSRRFGLTDRASA